MQPANEATVLGDFNDVRLTQAGISARFFRRGAKFVVHTEGPGGRPADFEIAYTFGVEPLQQYLVEFPGGRLQSLALAWDTKAHRWFSLYPAEKFSLDDPLHWTGRYQNWNAMCAECHTTGLRKGYDEQKDAYNTTWVALGVGCQACHGPGQAHVTWAQTVKDRRAAGNSDPGLVLDLRRANARGQVDACGACHSRRSPLDVVPRPDRAFLDEYAPQTLTAGLYHADGQQLGEVYEWGSFRQSQMYQRGVRCTDCHSPHSGKLKASGNALCTRCHREQPDPQFPTLQARAYDAPTHHFHKSGSPGARCVGCHMAARTYMMVDPRRDHSLRIPRPDLSVKLGTPDACTSCHTDRSPQWAAAAIRKWYGPTRARHWAEAIAAGRAGTREAAPTLIALATDASQPAIVRATALELLRPYGLAGSAAMTSAARDADAQVRVAAVGGLTVLPPAARLAAAAPFLKDAVRAVRVEAARVLAGVPVGLFDSGQRQAFDAGLAEFKAAQTAMADLPPAHLNMGVVYADMGQRDQAVAAYQTALRLDPYFLPARTNLAALYNAAGRNAEAERLLRDGIARAPGEGELHYSLGLILAEDGQMAGAATSLGEAARLLPNRARVRYNYGLALQTLGRRPEAEAALLAAQQLDPADPQIAYALVTFYIQRQQYRRAMAYAERLMQLLPADPGPRQLLDRLRRQVNGRP
jgi:predicted CXXCH cytochrome family protein